MSDSKLLGPDGRAVPESLCVTYNGKKYPYRVIDEEVFASIKVNPMVALMGVVVQMGDQNNLLWLAMLTLAKDMYSRDQNVIDTEGRPVPPTREFETLAKQLNLNIIDMERNSTSIADELSKV